MPRGVYVRSANRKSNNAQKWIRQCPGCKVIMGATHKCRVPIPFEDRLFSKIEKTATCWIWKRGVCKDGYPRMYSHEGKRGKASRAVHLYYKGPIPEGFYVCHTCDNKRCVNPEHLYAGTPQDNANDMVVRGRVQRVCGEKHIKAILTLAQVKEIRKGYPGSGSQAQLGKRYGVSKSAIAGILRGRNWKS